MPRREILCDLQRLKQILMNLITNAVKYTDEGFVEYGARPADNGMIELYVRDTGRGISENERMRIFDNFYQAECNRGTGENGTGLGLAITKQLVELMGGRIQVISDASVPGSGSTFFVYIPCGEIDKAGRKSGPCTALTDTVGYSDEYTVLIVEDNAVNQTLLKRILEKFGLSCRIANNSGEALSVLGCGQKIDLVFMDLTLPDASGYETLRFIRKLQVKGQVKSSIPVIALTAASMSEDREKCIREGFDDYMSKPVNIDVLQGVLCRYLISSPVT